MSQNVHVHIQEAESTQLLDDLFKTPEKFEEHFLRFTVSVLLSVGGLSFLDSSVSSSLT